VAGIYLSFQMLVLAALVARARGWSPAGAFTLGGWAYPVNVAAFVFGVAGIVDMMWPRNPQEPWYSNYGMLVGGAAVLLSGVTYMVLAKPYAHGTAPAGDAHLLGVQPMRQRASAATAR